MNKKPTYEELAESLNELNRIFNFSTDMIGSGTLDGYFTKVNSSFKQLLGYTQEEILRHPFILFVHDEDVEKTKKALADAIEGKKEIYIENRYKCKDGSYKWIEWKVSSIVQESKFVAVGRDITDRKKTENGLQASEHFLNNVFNAIQDGLSVLDTNLNVIKTNRWMEQMYMQKMPLVDQKCYHVYQDRKSPCPWCPTLQTIQTGKVHTSTVPYPSDDNPMGWIELTAFPIKDERGHVTKIIEYVKDITDRIRAEESLRESEKRLRHISDTTFEGIVLHDHGKIIYANDQYYKMFGYTKEELRGADAISLTVSPNSIKKMKKMISSGGLGPYQVTGVKKNGERFPIEVHAKASEYRGQKIRMAAIRDITRYKNAEEETRKALEYAAEQSKHALIGQVAGKMAHDFNNVLMGIMGNAQLALIYCDDENTKTKLENIYEFSERGKDITNNLISFSKDQEPKQTYFKIENKIELVLNMLEKDLADIEVSRNYQKGIPELLADPGMIQDVLTNLIQNSVHAMSRIKNPALTLKAYFQDDMVYFEIEDNGCGIPKEHQRSIFTPSFTLKGSHDKTGSYKSGIKGTGYGLSNVKKYIVEKHKGDIFLESEAGKGTKITIALKIIKKRLSPDEQREVAKSQIYGKRRILLVEDEPAIADVQYQILTKDPFRHIVSLAVNGQTAVDIFDRNEFDVVSLDYMLPGDINGLDVYYHIRENDKDIPVVFISGNIEFIASMNQLKEKDPHLDHLPKPVNNLEYVNKINALIGRRNYKHGGSL